MNPLTNAFETRCLSSLSKVFADAELTDEPVETGSALIGETYSFQVAYRYGQLAKDVRVTIDADFVSPVTIRTVGLAPSDYPIQAQHDDRILRHTPGLYPDPLYDMEDGTITLLPGQWRTLWITVDVRQTDSAGAHTIRVVFEAKSGERYGEAAFQLDVIPVKLPEQKLLHTEWFHTDCLATYYKADVFSERHWQLIDRYVETAVKHGVNMILTPLFTPPLDTEVGGERPTVQLVDVEKSGDSYTFGFDRLTRWIDLCDARGVRYFEFSHLFTQWGAKHAPKIIATENGIERRIFGWDTDAAGDEYRTFLEQFIPALLVFIRERGLESRSYFHVSDEPGKDHLESYGAASKLVRTLLEGFPVIDALSKVEFYEQGLVKIPVASNNHIEPFLERSVDPLWTYYCVSQYYKVSNRFFCMPSARNRIIGFQLYKFNITGFLHWGYNFWYTQYSRKRINPYVVTDAGGAFPSGDPFLVYPGEDGPVESIRLNVFAEALQDLRALQKLESLIGREQTIALIEEGLEQPLTFSEYPIAESWLLGKRERINRLIAEHGTE